MNDIPSVVGPYHELWPFSSHFNEYYYDAPIMLLMRGEYVCVSVKYKISTKSPQQPLLTHSTVLLPVHINTHNIHHT